MVESGALNNLEPSPWRGISAIEKLILVFLPLLAVAVIVLPFLDQIVIRRLARLPGARPVVTWLVNDSSAWLVGAAIMGLFALFALWVRRRLTNNKRLWFGTGCPQCMERELVRVTRKTSDRNYGLIGIPAYRYACRNCTWRGLRIARREHSAEHMAELEASLRRFDPDAPLPPPPTEIDSSAPDETAPQYPSGPTSIFYDPGDVGYLNAQPNPAGLEEDEPEDMPEDADLPANAEPAGELEWLWRRSSES